jgi:hypothetical protein
VAATSLIDEAERRCLLPLEFRAVEDAGCFGPDNAVDRQAGWLVESPPGLSEVGRRPEGDALRERTPLVPGQAVSPAAFSDPVLDVADIVIRVPLP